MIRITLNLSLDTLLLMKLSSYLIAIYLLLNFKKDKKEFKKTGDPTFLSGLTMIAAAFMFLLTDIFGPSLFVGVLVMLTLVGLILHSHFR